MQGRARKHDDDHEPSPFDGIQKNIVLNESRCFNDRQINAQKCSEVMTKLLYLINQGELLTSREATDVFFGVTKLFQNKDVHMRRLMYLVIRELSVNPDESLIVVNCLNKDMTSNVDLFKGNAIRVLSKIIDSSMLVQIDRFLKQAIVDKNPLIVSSALVSGLLLFRTSPEVIKRWVNDVQEALTNKSRMVQYHALNLLYKIKQQDRLAVSKVVTSLSRKVPKGPLAQCLLLRQIAALLSQQPNPDRELLKFMHDSLHNKNFMVIYEAARCLCAMPNISAGQLQPAITVLQEFLTSPVPAQKFAAVRTLSEVVKRFPPLVAPCSVDLEHLLTDPNRSIATLAITALLKTGVESSVDRLLKSISGFMSDITDEFKVVLVDAIKTLALKFPHKYKSLMHFLSSALRDEGGKAYKSAIVNALLDVITHNPQAKEEGLEHFCEFIEDCEFPDLSVKILHLLGTEGPKTTQPHKYIRFIFNRMILEVPQVRCAAADSLAMFGAAVPALTNSIIVLLQRVVNDNDDEVRDRVVLSLDLLVNKREVASEVYTSSNAGLDVPLKQLEGSLQIYVEGGEGGAPQPFNLQSDLVEIDNDAFDAYDVTAVRETGALDMGDDDTEGAAAGASGASGVAAVANAAPVVFVNPYLEVLKSIPEFEEFGELFNSSAPVAVTEEEAEYQVTCVKHIYANHVIFQFNVTNNMEDQLLENVQVEMESASGDWEEDMSVPEPSLAFNNTGACFVVMERPSEEAFVSGPLTCELKFDVRDVDSSGEIADDSVEDTYQLEEVQVVEKDFCKPGPSMGLVEFKSAWEQLGDSCEEVKKFSLGMNDLQGAINAVLDRLGLQACENSDQAPEDARSHAVNLYGSFLGGHAVLCRAGFLLDPKLGVALKIAVRSNAAHVAQLMTTVIR